MHTTHVLRNTFILSQLLATDRALEAEDFNGVHPLHVLAQDTLRCKVVVTGATGKFFWLLLLSNLSHASCHMLIHAVAALNYLTALRAPKSQNTLQTTVLTLKGCVTC